MWIRLEDQRPILSLLQSKAQLHLALPEICDTDHDSASRDTHRLRFRRAGRESAFSTTLQEDRKAQLRNTRIRPKSQKQGPGSRGPFSQPHFRGGKKKGKELNSEAMTDLVTSNLLSGKQLDRCATRHRRVQT